MKICLTGDVFLGGDLLNFDSKVIYSEVFNQSNVRIINLEQSVSNSEFSENKSTLYTTSSAIKKLKDWNVNAVNLANNHIHDKGLDGINETIQHLNDEEIPSFGAGKNIRNAKEFFSIGDGIVILGYCDFNKPTLNNIAVASNDCSGINPLRYENIIDDLSALKGNMRAILYFHWGREHMWFPSYENIQLARKLLEHDKVLTIVGMHPHRIQGYIKHNNKKAYMCLGNFIFPNFFMLPPTAICENPVHGESYLITRKYHVVSKLTYKKWSVVNRISMILELDSKSNNIVHHFVYQKDDKPEVHDVSVFWQKILNSFVAMLSFIYCLPRVLYLPIEKINIILFKIYWNISIYIFRLKQDGFMIFFKKCLKKLKLL
ncbi:hypothetical protein EAH57_12995 [Acinetobacter sp. 2JN-4]|uniref:CapA family protein n=1 Tax=Acinetobacter sp. 2JN-4 TaxID=2479844 RepID=UPI000EF9D268|nr:CapA family protein [Acinetobacter sp. 2JN-4]RLZ07473.1 hypothetical protein EAH57_12995 [Acinetobacter sp. 2JN-4]